MSQINARLVYKNAYRAITRAGANPATAILSQSFLRLEVTLATNRTSYQFPVLVNDSSSTSTSQRVTEQRLNLQDAFYVGSIQMFLGLASSATDTEYYPISYPNSNLFTTSGAKSALYNFYQGVLSISVNNRTILTAWDVERHLYVPQTQQNATLASGVNQDQIDGATATSFSVEPNIVLIGSKNNQINLTLPNAVGTLQASKTTIVTLLLRGILAQNVTPVS
jgi:hypothetical protein